MGVREILGSHLSPRRLHSHASSVRFDRGTTYKGRLDYLCEDARCQWQTLTLLLTVYGISFRVGGHIVEFTNGREGRLEKFAVNQVFFDSEVVEGNSGTNSFEAACLLAVHDTPVTYLWWHGSALLTLLFRGTVMEELRLGGGRGAQPHISAGRSRSGDSGRQALQLGRAYRSLSRLYPCGPAAVEVEVGRGPIEETVQGLLGWEDRTTVTLGPSSLRLSIDSGPKFDSSRGPGRSSRGFNR